MKQRIVLWGQNESNEKVLVAAALDAAENKVITTIFPADNVTEEFVSSMMKSWRNGHDIPFPLGYLQFERELTITEPMIPEKFNVEREDILKRAQAEWNFAVLSHKMFDAFSKELDDLVERVQQVSKFEPSVWEQLKGYWTKVQSQIRERNLHRMHSEVLRSRTNELFDQLKSVRKKQDHEFKKISEEFKEKFKSALDEIDEKVEGGLSLQPLFDRLKKLQRDLKDADMTRDHRDKTWKRLDGLFKKIKEKRYGSKAGSGNNALQRLQRRYEGLLNAVNKMEKSIQRDKSDLNYQQNKGDGPFGQLEVEMRKAKIQMIEERIRSKTQKHEDMLKTKSVLESRIEKEKQREAKRQEAEKVKAEKERIKKQVEAELKEKQAGGADAEKLQEAAEAINEGRKRPSRSKPATKSSRGAGPSDQVILAAAAVSSAMSSLPDVLDEEE